MELCKRHCSWVEPAVDNLRHSCHRLATLRAFNVYSVDIRLMKFDFIRAIIAHWFKFFNAADNVSFAAFTFPNRKRCTPVSFSWKTPVDYVFKEVTHTSFLDVFRKPVYWTVVCNKLISYGCHLDKPFFSCIVKKRCITSPAVRIAVFKRNSRKEFAFFFKKVKNHLVTVFYKYACPRLNFCCKVTLCIYILTERKTVCLTYTVIVFTECSCYMNNACTVFCCNVVVCNNFKAVVVIFYKVE